MFLAQKISFGGIPNSSIIYIYIYIYMNPFAMFEYTHGASFLRSGFAHVDNAVTNQCSKQSDGCSSQGCRTGTLRNLPPQHTPARAGTLRNRNPPKPSGTFRNPPDISGTCLRNLHQHTPKLHSGTFRNLAPKPTPWPQPPGTARRSAELSGTLPPEPSETLELSGTLRHLPPEARTLQNLQPSGNCLRNLHQHTPEPSKTFRNRNLSPEHTKTEPFGRCLQNLHQHTPELSGTCARNLKQHTPELCRTFWHLPPKPAPATRTNTHRSLSRLKTPLAYAFRE